MKRIFAISFFLMAVISINGNTQIISGTKSDAYRVSLDHAVIACDENEPELIKRSAALLQQDIQAVTGNKIPIITKLLPEHELVIYIGTLEKSSLIKELQKTNRINLSSIRNKWEAYSIQTLPGKQTKPGRSPLRGILIAGSDRRGAAFGVFELSRQMGVSPWYWWADVPVKKTSSLYFNPNASLTDSPKVKYRGIFINDEAPALSNWTKEKLGGFNHRFYEKVFELMLRLKANYLWPAMWGNAFYYDDSLNIKMADDYGIVIGTSHHEPMMRAHEEWKYYGHGRKWHYDSTEAGLKEYWKGGMKRAWNEKIVSIGMRGDGDEPMTRETATSLLERIVKDQRKIIEEVTGKPASATPQLWALYKEVQDYYDKGMRVPDDVTLLLCDDNWGNIRKLPKLNEKPRKGGYGIYYHFDYVGGPRNYKWINTNPLPRIWEQMHLAWEYMAREIWIVNVGDIKPMEFPISFWCDYAWNPERIKENDLQKYTEQWAAEQFGNTYAVEIADLLSKYAKYNSRRKPELLDANTFELFEEWETVRHEYNRILDRAKSIHLKLPQVYSDAYYQLVYHPIKAMANLYDLYHAVAWNRYYAGKNNPHANSFAKKAIDFYSQDSIITLEYHQINNGKWNHMMSQAHIGYTNWQQPPRQTMPEVKIIPGDPELSLGDFKLKITGPPTPERSSISFFEWNNHISIEADNYTNAVNSNSIKWTVLPDHGRTGAAITAFPVTHAQQKPGKNAPHLEYEIHTTGSDSMFISAYFSPTLKFHNAEEGLQYAISVDDEQPQIISTNKEDRNTGRGIWNKWVAENIIIKKSRHFISKPGKHIIKYWLVDPGVVLQKMVVDFGKLIPTYLGPPETKFE